MTGLRAASLLLAAAALAAAPAPVDTVRVRADRGRGIPRPVPFEALPAPIGGILADPAIVTVRLTEPLLSGNYAPSDPRRSGPAIRGYAYRSEPRRLTANEARRVGELVLSEQFHNPGEKACTFQPNVAYAFVGRGHHVVVLACHGCKEASFIRLGEFVTSRHLDHVNDELLSIAISAFPEDATLKELRRR